MNVILTYDQLKEILAEHYKTKEFHSIVDMEIKGSRRTKASPDSSGGSIHVEVTFNPDYYTKYSSAEEVKAEEPTTFNSAQREAAELMDELDALTKEPAPQLELPLDDSAPWEDNNSDNAEESKVTTLEPKTEAAPRPFKRLFGS